MNSIDSESTFLDSRDASPEQQTRDRSSHHFPPYFLCSFLFTSTIITLVLATDIMDKELGAQRKARWAKAFSGEETPATDEEEEGGQVHINRKATIVLEHLIQASDVAHTMQHWHVYKVRCRTP